MTHEVNEDSSTTLRSAPLKHSQEEGYIFDPIKRRWVADTRDGKRICNQCKERQSLEDFTGNKQKSHTCRFCRRYIKASQRYNISYQEAKALYNTTFCECCNIEFDTEKYRQCIHHLEIGGEKIVRGVVCKACNWLLQDENSNHKKRIEQVLKFMADEDKV